MRFGCCVPPDKIEIIARAGFDFCELPASAVQPLDDDAAALPALRAIAAAPLRPEAFNVLVPATLPLVGPHADLAAMRAYLRDNPSDRHGKFRYSTDIIGEDVAALHAEFARYRERFGLEIEQRS